MKTILKNQCMASIWRYLMNWVFDIVVIRAINPHNSDFFFSNGKKANQRVHFGPVCSDLLHKNKFAHFSFFWPTKGFFIKKSNDFQPFWLRKLVTLLARGLRVGSDGYFYLVLLRNEPLWWKMALIAFTCINNRLKRYYYIFSS